MARALDGVVIEGSLTDWADEKTYQEKCFIRGLTKFIPYMGRSISIHCLCAVSPGGPVNFNLGAWRANIVPRIVKQRTHGWIPAQ